MNHYIRAVILRYFILALILFIAGSANAQNQTELDSVIAAYNRAAHDTSRAIALLTGGEIMYYQDPDSAMKLWELSLVTTERALENAAWSSEEIRTLKYLHGDALNNVGFRHNDLGEMDLALDYYLKSLAIRTEIGAEQAVSNSLNNIGLLYYRQGEMEKALESYFKSQSIREKADDDMPLGITYNNIGLVYKKQGNIERALHYYFKCLDLAERNEHKRGMSVALSNIGALYAMQDDPTNALDFHEKSLALREEIGHKRGVAESLNNIATVYKSQASEFKMVDSLEQCAAMFKRSLDYFFRSLELKRELKNKKGIAVALYNIGGTYRSMDSIDLALKFTWESIAYASAANDMGWEATARALVGDIYFNKGNIDSARHYASIAHELSVELGSPSIIVQTSELLWRIYKSEKTFEQALQLYELHIKMRDSIKNEETQKATIRQQTKYEFEKAQLIKEQEEKELARVESERTTRRDNLQYSVILIALLILFGGVLSIGFIKVSPKMTEGIVFFSFLILFEFLLVLADPYIESWSGGAPGIKLLFNAGIAALIFPAHAFFEAKLKSRLVKRDV